MKYKYIGLDAAGDEKQGFVEAETESAAIDQLKDKGIYPLELSATEVANKNDASGNQENAASLKGLGKRVAVLIAISCCAIIIIIFKDPSSKIVVPIEISIAFLLSFCIFAAVVFFKNEPVHRIIFHIAFIIIAFVLLVAFGEYILKPFFEWIAESNK